MTFFYKSYFNYLNLIEVYFNCLLRIHYIVKLKLYSNFSYENFQFALMLFFF